MISLELDQTTSVALAGSDLSNLADGLAGAEFSDPKPAVPEIKTTRPAAPATNARPECRPVAAGGMFAALHPECAQDYLDRFQQLRTQLMLHRSRVTQEFRTVAVMSTRRGEGKSFTATNLAATLAAGSAQGVLLIDGNPEGAELPLGVDVLKGGLTQALAEPEKWARSIHSVMESSLSVMPRGRTSARSIDFTNLPRLFAQLRRKFEWIVLDGASFATSPDAEWLSSVADGTLVVTQGGTIGFDAFQDTLLRIPEERRVGVVFNTRPQPKESFKLRLRFTGKWKRAGERAGIERY
ncbi:MAG: hypothetical protein ABIR70_09080 [Bryobacteraceae bacterium]